MHLCSRPCVSPSSSASFSILGSAVGHVFVNGHFPNAADRGHASGVVSCAHAFYLAPPSSWARVRSLALPPEIAVCHHRSNFIQPGLGHTDRRSERVAEHLLSSTPPPSLLVRGSPSDLIDCDGSDGNFEDASWPWWAWGASRTSEERRVSKSNRSSVRVFFYPEPGALSGATLPL